MLRAPPEPGSFRKPICFGGEVKLASVKRDAIFCSCHSKHIADVNYPCRAAPNYLVFLPTRSLKKVAVDTRWIMQAGPIRSVQPKGLASYIPQLPLPDSSVSTFWKVTLPNLFRHLVGEPCLVWYRSSRYLHSAEVHAHFDT